VTLRERSGAARGRKAPGARPAGGARRPSLEVEFFRFVNRWVEPQIRAGLGSPRLVPGGLIVLETTGRKSGRRARIPLVATRLQGYVLVGTFRGKRSQWAKNLAAHPEVRFWMGGRARPATAFLLTSSRRPRPLPKLPPLLRAVMALLVPYTRAGWIFAILAPRRRRRQTPGGRALARGRRGQSSGSG
jgi:deazaflavin-dependent oxidoreductase (nitroreductase family)